MVGWSTSLLYSSCGWVQAQSADQPITQGGELARPFGIASVKVDGKAASLTFGDAYENVIGLL